MYQEQIKYLKRKIKRTYKRYTGERTDGQATLTDVAKFFNIPIDESRVADYQITKIDFNYPSIEILDTKTNTKYNAHYTCNADLFNCYGGEVKYNSLISTNENRRLESLYYICDETPIITVMKFRHNDYELVFEKEMPNFVGIFGNPNVKFIVRYLKNINYEGKNVQQSLLTKIFGNKYVEDSGFNYDDSFEQFYTYRTGQHYIERMDDQNKYSYIRNNSLIYGINKLEQKDVYIQGICFENTGIDKNYTYPYGIRERDYPRLNDDKTNSAMIFRGGINKAQHHSLEIYKSDETIYLKYYIRRFRQNGIHTEVLIDQEINLPILGEKNITSEEIQNIVLVLQSQYKDDEFIQLVSNELNTFGTKIDVRKGLFNEELDQLSPKLLIDKTFDEICDLVSSNKEDYFNLISNQFESAINIAKQEEKGKVKVLKINNNLQSGKN